MREPDDEFENAFMEEGMAAEASGEEAAVPAPSAKAGGQPATRRKIEELLEKKRLRAEFGDLADF